VVVDAFRSNGERVAAELERSSLRAVRVSFEDLNATFFKRALRAPAFELVDAESRLGRWVHAQRTIELSRHLLAAHGWGVLVEVLKHEMAHQFVDEVLGIRDEPAHGPAFRQVCAERGFDARAAGVPASQLGAHTAESKILERVARLLALAESPNVHEAQAAMNAAQRLMLKHNIESIGAHARHGYTFRHLGRASGRVQESQRLLALILGEHFFVQAIWVPVWRPLEGKRGSVLEVCGALENVEMAEYVHSFLAHTAERLWIEHKRSHRIRSNADRRTFVSGVMSGFKDRLDSERRANARQGLVWVGDAALDTYFRARHPHVRWTRYTGSRKSEAYVHGREAGKQIVLHRGIRQGASDRTPLLPARGGRSDATP